jgi:xanthine/uracil permease
MASHEGARRITWVGSLITKVGGFVGVALCLAAFAGRLSYFWPKLFLLPVVVGSAISFIGLTMERLAKQSDVGRQCDNRNR